MNYQSDQNDEDINTNEPWNHKLNAPKARFSHLALSEIQFKLKKGKQKAENDAKELNKDQEKAG